MAYAGDDYGPGSAYAGNATNAINPIPASGWTTEKCAAALVIGALASMILIRRGFRGVSVSRMTGGLVRS
jgi:hypothetical protein